MNNETANDDFMARRNVARAELNAKNPRFKPGGDESDPTHLDWFSYVYDFAQEDAAKVPWARLSANLILTEWLERNGPLSGVRALDVGCGLGDNAEALSAMGAVVTAFDFAQRAIEWAKKRFPQTSVAYRTADLFDTPLEWRAAFDLIHECYTLQTLPPEFLPRAAQALTALLAPGGRLLVITSAREKDEPQTTSYQPLTRDEIENLAVEGLILESIEDLPARTLGGSRHFRAVFRRIAGAHP